jgi:hypothetical protein
MAAHSPSITSRARRGALGRKRIPISAQASRFNLKIDFLDKSDKLNETNSKFISTPWLSITTNPL